MVFANDTPAMDAAAGASCTSTPGTGTRRRRTAAASALVLGLAVAGMAYAAPATALAKIKCKQTTGTASVDPIVHHNEPVGGAMGSMIHQHQFFGNNAWLAKGNAANYADLVGKGTNCANAADTAGYWTPTLRYTGSKQLIPTQAFTAYYRPYTGSGSKTGIGQAFPADTRLVASKYDWNCGDQAGVAPQSSIPSCAAYSGKPGYTLTAHVDFPSCWDGVLPKHSSSDVGNTTDNAHYAYPVKNACPSAFPNRMVQLRETIQFQYTGNGTDVELSSDPMTGKTDGQSMHADFWNAWVQSGLQSMVAHCVTPGGAATTAECG